MAETNAACTNSTYDWTFNSLGQNPCVIASYLGGDCNGGDFTVSALQSGAVYLGPTLLTANVCRCSSVFYSLISACALCQSEEYLSWSVYSFNCTVIDILEQPGSFTDVIPSGTKVPHYAYLDVTVADEFDPVAAKAAGDAPESTGIAIPSISFPSISIPDLATSTSFGFPTTVPHTSGSSSTHKSSNAGAIAGGVIGGLLGLALVAALAFWLSRRNRNKTAPSAMVNTGYAAPGQPMSPPPMSFNTTTTGPSRLYDPSDPTTFPTPLAPPSVMTGSDQPFLQPDYSGNTNYGAGSGRHYTGAPEI